MARHSAIGLIVGLGNPGAEYSRTRHNAGFWLLDSLADQLNATFNTESRFKGELARASIGGHTVWLLKPATFMNDSGRSVGACASYYKIAPAGMFVAHDELSLPAGRLALKRGGGHGGHNGLRDITRHCSGDFIRARIGIGRPREGNDVARYVLNSPPATEREQIEAAIGAGLSAIELIISGDLDKAGAAIAKQLK